MKKPSVLAIIPARGGSKRIPGKNIRLFAGRPLIVRTIAQANAAHFVSRTIVDTDSKEIAKVARKAGAEVPFLRPKSLARDSSKVVQSIMYVLLQLKQKEGYVPDYVMILQTTSPLRESSDINACWQLMKKGGATTVLTITPTHPRLYHLKKGAFISLANKSDSGSTNVQAWPEGYILNGCFVYIVQTKALLKERQIITKKTRAVISPKWRSIDLDTPEDWVVAELMHKHRNEMVRSIRRFK